MLPPALHPFILSWLVVLVLFWIIAQCSFWKSKFDISFSQFRWSTMRATTSRWTATSGWARSRGRSWGCERRRSGMGSVVKYLLCTHFWARYSKMYIFSIDFHEWIFFNDLIRQLEVLIRFVNKFDIKYSKLDHRTCRREARHGSRLNRKMNFDFAGRKVVEADGGVAEYDPAMVR